MIPAPPPSPADQGRKADADKPRWTLLPWPAISAVVEVLEYGARKYAPNNWQAVEGAEQRYRDALLRHLVADMSGEERDAESGLLHAAHVATNALFLLWFALRRSQ